ncbi:MAG: ribose-phosphate diphosphokinase, partial [Hyphomicrobiales bacterium]
IQGFFDIPTDNLFAAPVIVNNIKDSFDVNNVTVVSPDVGGVVRARLIAERIGGAPLAIVDKRRDKPGQSEVMNIIGDVEGRSCILVDDIVDSGGTLCNAASKLLESGANDVSAYITHGVLSGEAVNKIETSDLKNLIISDTIYNESIQNGSKKIKLISVAQLLGEAILRTSNEESVSSLFI